MFQLLDKLKIVPLEEDSLIHVRQGMNKVMVSVGEHISEPSEVFMVTGQEGNGVSTYVVFIMLEPKDHVIYGHEHNPYEVEKRDEVENEAVAFLEEMGAILENIEWENMAPDKKNQWLENSCLFVFDEEVTDLSADDILKESETGDDETESMDEDIREDESEQVVSEPIIDEDSDLEALDQLEDTEQQDTPDVSEGEVEKAEEEGDGEKDVVYSEDSFDELLKEAFLKPEVSKAASRSKTRRVTSEEIEAEEELEKIKFDGEEDDLLRAEMESLDREAELAEIDDSDSDDEVGDEHVENGDENTLQDAEVKFEVDEEVEVQETADGKDQAGSDQISPEQDRPDPVPVEDRQWVLRFFSRI